MSENLPPSETPSPKPDLPQRSPPELGFGVMFVLGIGLVIVSGIFCLLSQSPVPLGLGALVALVTLFINGWRGVFVGFVTVIGILLLGIVVICGAMGVPDFR